MTKYIRASYTLEVPDDQEAQVLHTLRGLPDVFNVHTVFTDVTVGEDHDAMFRKVRDRFIEMMKTCRGEAEQVFYNKEDSDTFLLAPYSAVGNIATRIFDEGLTSRTWGVPVTWHAERTEALLKDGTRVSF